MKNLKDSHRLLLLIVLAAATLANAKAPVRARMTLLSLYAKSDLVAIGRYDKKEEVGTNRVSDGFTVVTTKTSYSVSTVLKGEALKFVTIEDEEFHYQVQQNGVPRAAVFVDENNARDEDIKPGDTVLLFLISSGDPFLLVDDRDGVRKISAVEQSIYSDRIKELNSIFETKPVDQTKIASWLVRCVEHPATRWDGTHELIQGFRQTEWNKVKDPNGYERIDSSVTSEHGREAAAALTDDLKERLTQILISSDFAPTSKSPALSDGDRELIALVKRWNPTAAARYLVGQLKSLAYSAHENSGMMFKIAELVGDGRTSTLWRQYVDSARDELSIVNGNDRQALLLDRFIRVAENDLSKLTTSRQNGSF